MTDRVSRPARVIGHNGRLEQREDGSIVLSNWHTEGGDHLDPIVNGLDAIIALLQEKRDEQAANPPPLIEVQL